VQAVLALGPGTGCILFTEVLGRYSCAVCACLCGEVGMVVPTARVYRVAFSVNKRGLKLLLCLCMSLVAPSVGH
jgi:hypothetical protein